MRDDMDIPMPAMGPTGSASASYRVARPREGMDPNTRKLALIAAGIGGTLLVLFTAWSFTGPRRTGVPVVEADIRPLREKPANAGGMQVAGKDETILSGKSEGQAALAPASEAPAPQALKPVVAAAAPVVAPAVVAPVVTPAPTVAAATPARSAVVASAPPKAAAVVVPTAAKPAAVVAPAGHGAQIQLAAVGTEQAAISEWQRLEKKMPDLLGGRKPAVSKIERDGKTFWRLRTGGFADATAAKSFCEQVKSKSGGGCTVAAF